MKKLILHYLQETGDPSRCIEVEHAVGKCLDCDFLRAVDALHAGTAGA